MKQSLFFSLIALLFLTFSCKTDPVGPNGEIPNLEVDLDFKENGTSIESLVFSYEKQQPSAGSTATAGGSYQSLTDLFLIQILGKPGSIGPTFLISGPISGLTAGTYQVMPQNAGNPLANAYSSFVTEGSESFTSSSGTFKLSNLNEYADIGVGAAEHFMDIEVNMTMTSSDGSRTLEVSGTIKGINIKSN